jgi:hypothetical protein
MLIISIDSVAFIIFFEHLADTIVFLNIMSITDVINLISSKR